MGPGTYIQSRTTENAMIPNIGQVEEFSRLTPLGLRFWDTLSEQPVGEGLEVSAYPEGEPERRTNAIMNRSGIYILHNLPGIRELEFGSGDRDFWLTVRRKPFIIEVTHRQDWFQPFTFMAALPFQGLFTSPCAISSPISSGAADEGGIPLYSSVTRSCPSGIAVIYASLWDAANARPASWARVEATLDGQVIAQTFADAAGQLGLLFAYPEPYHSVFPPLTSPLLGQRPPLADQTWPLQLRVYYRPWNPVPKIPDLCQVLVQPLATLVGGLSPPSPLGEIDLKYGQKLVLRSEPESSVWVLP
jgi:hypothetical protein